MPSKSDFYNIIKYCEQCGAILELNNNRDITRKRFCSRKCLGIKIGLTRDINFMRKIQKLSCSPMANLKKSHKGMTHPRAKPLYTKTIHDGTYIQIKIRESGRWIYEHRWIISKKINRLLKKDEVVHHINGNGLDNRLKNLMLLTKGEHTKIHKGGKNVSIKI